MEVYSIKQGTTFEIKDAQWLDDGGEPINISNVAIDCQLNTYDKTLVHNFTFTKAFNNLSFSSNVANTETWPEEDLLGDIKFVENGKTLYTDTFIVRVGRKETP
jgi:hypothetical protein